MLVPSGTEFVAGSARVVAGTGSESVRVGANVTTPGSAIRLILPAHVEDGSSCTPPAFEFQLKVTAAAGGKIVQRFSRYEVDAKATRAPGNFMALLWHIGAATGIAVSARNRQVDTCN